MAQIPAAQWDTLLAHSCRPTPFMRHAYLLALEASGAAAAETGWLPRHAVLESATGELLAACPLYLKNHSYGEYVFDQAWAHACLRSGMAYYPKAVIAVPFTPVPGSRIIGLSDRHCNTLLHHLVQYVQTQQLSSLHLLWGCAADMKRFGELPESNFHLGNLCITATTEVTMITCCRCNNANAKKSVPNSVKEPLHNLVCV